MDSARRVPLTEEPWDEFFRNPALSFSAHASLRDLFDELRESDQPVTLVLGAGVSLDAGLPTWSGLVANIASQIQEDRWHGPVREDPSDPMRKAEAVLQMAVERKPATRSGVIRTALYPPGALPTPGPLADAIARLILTLRRRVSVVTTNFDTLLEQALEALDPSVAVISHSMDSRPMAVDGDAIEVLHLHGLIPAQKDDVAGPIVLTESEFLEHGRRAQSYIEDALKSSLVIFVGVSLSDPNLVGPLWRLKEQATAEYRPPFIVTVTSIPPGAENPDNSRAYVIKSGAYLEAELHVRTIFLKSFAQIPQLFHEMVLSLREEQYFDTATGVGLRYGQRLSRTLDKIHVALDCGGTDDMPSKEGAARLTELLHGKLYGPGGLAGNLSELVDTMLTSRHPGVAQLADKYAKDLRAEKYGLFLWIRSRAQAARAAEFELRLMGTSVYTHTEPWSLDRVAPIEQYSRHVAARACYRGQTLWRQLYDSREWQLWRSCLAVPFNVYGSESQSMLGARNFVDVLSVGVITLNSRNGRQGVPGVPVSILSLMQQSHIADLKEALADIALETIQEAPSLGS